MNFNSIVPAGMSMYNISRSAAISLVQGNTYEFTYIKPNAQVNPGAIENFTTTTIEVTVKDIEPVGNSGKVRYTMERDDTSTEFFITLDNKGIYSIQGFAGEPTPKEWYLNSIGKNDNGLDGAWAGLMGVSSGGGPTVLIPMNFLINGNLIIVTNGFPEGDDGYPGASESRLQITSKTGDTINLANNPTTRIQASNHMDTNGEWVLQYVGTQGNPENNCAYILKKVEYAIEDDILTIMLKEYYAISYGFEESWEDITSTEFKFRRIPID
jgi:hypothetical protein